MIARPRVDLSFSKNDTLIKLIYVNVAVYLLTKILFILFWLFQLGGQTEYFIINYFAVPSDIGILLTRPWTIFTYMFLHVGFFHLLFNMVMLYFGGQLFMSFLGNRKLWTLYIGGGLAGAVLYILFYNTFPVFSEVLSSSKALGASASVMAILVGVATYAPNFSVRMLLIGEVKLKYIAIALFVIDILSISNSNSGGHIAHLGGAAMGFLFAKQWKKGHDITAGIGKAGDYFAKLFSPSRPPKMKVKYKKKASDYEYNKQKKERQEEIDAILDKISKSGYNSLTKSEKDKLFDASNKS